YVLWDMTYDSYRPDGEISDGDTWNVAGIRLKALHTPGHSPGSTCFFVETGLPAPVSAGAGRAVGPVPLSGDALFGGGPGGPRPHARCDGTACRQMRHGRGSRPLHRLRPASACSAADG